MYNHRPNRGISREALEKVATNLRKQNAELLYIVKSVRLHLKTRTPLDKELLERIESLSR